MELRQQLVAGELDMKHVEARLIFVGDDEIRLLQTATLWAWIARGSKYELLQPFADILPTRNRRERRQCQAISYLVGTALYNFEGGKVGTPRLALDEEQTTFAVTVVGEAFQKVARAHPELRGDMSDPTESDLGTLREDERSMFDLGRTVSDLMRVGAAENVGRVATVHQASLQQY